MDKNDPGDPIIRGCVGIALAYSFNPHATWPEEGSDCAYDSPGLAFAMKCKGGHDPFVFAHQFDSVQERHTHFNYITYAPACKKCVSTREGGYESLVALTSCEYAGETGFLRTLWCRQCPR